MTLRHRTLVLLAAILSGTLAVSRAMAEADAPRKDQDRPAAREGEGREKARAAEQEMRDRRLKELTEQAAALRRQVEAAQREKPGREAAEARERAAQAAREGGFQVRPGAPQVPQAAVEQLRQLERERQELEKSLERVRKQEAELRERLMAQRARAEGDRPQAAPNPSPGAMTFKIESAKPEAARPRTDPQRPAAQAGKEGPEGIRIVVNGREINLGGEKGGFVVREGGEGREARPPNPAPGAARPQPLGGGWQAVPEASPSRPGAPLPPGPAPVVGPARPLAAAPTPGPQVRPPAPPAEPTQQLRQMIGALHTMSEAVSDPRTAAMMAIGALKDEVKNRPIAGVRALEAALRTTRSLPLRTAIHLSLKDLYKAQGNDVMVVRHLMAVIAENDEAMRPAREPAARLDAPRERDRREMSGRPPRDKDDDDDDD